jgi:hypothetical protein
VQQVARLAALHFTSEGGSIGMKEVIELKTFKLSMEKGYFLLRQYIALGRNSVTIFRQH